MFCCCFFYFRTLCPHSLAHFITQNVVFFPLFTFTLCSCLTWCHSHMLLYVPVNLKGYNRHTFLQTHTSPLMCECCFVASVQMRNLFVVTTVNCLYHVTDMNVIIAAYYLYTLGWTKGVQFSRVHRICRQKPTWKKDILHYCVCSSVLIAMKYPHSFWCSAGRFTSFSCGLCHTEAQSVQIFVLIKPPHCSVQPGMCSWG